VVEIYTWSSSSRILVSLLLALCVAVQALVVLFSFYRRPRSRENIPEYLTELSILFQILILSLLHGQSQNSYYMGIIVQTGYSTLLYIATGLVILSACIKTVHSGGLFPLLFIFVSLLTLPAVETAFGNAYLWLYIVSLLFWFFRGLYRDLKWYREIRTSISSLSIKNAIDSLHTGVLFSGQDGFIMLINSQMLRLMVELTNKIHRNSTVFYDMLMSGELSPGCRRMKYDGHTVCLLPDDTAWMFTRTQLKIKNKQYMQFSATDITQQWALTAQLQRQEDQLKLRGEELRKTIDNLHLLSGERELQNAKLRTHDILNQRLVSIISMTRDGQKPDYDLLRLQSRSLLDDLKSNQTAASPQDKLRELQQECNTIGVIIRVDGDLPDNEIDGYTFTDIIRESTANAVRHGFANEVYVRLGNCDGVRYLEISNNGRPPSGEPVEGSGITAIREMLTKWGGSLRVTAQPQFILRAELPDCTREESV